MPKPKYVACPKCAHRNDRAGGRRKCVGCGSALPKRRVPPHARTLRDDSYAKYVEINGTIHGDEWWAMEACGVCGKPKPETRRHDRDHDHRTGLPRALACVRWNRELLRNATPEEARAVVAYLERAESFYAAGSSGE